MTDADVTLSPEQSSVLSLITQWEERGPISSGDLAAELGYDEIQVVRAVEALREFGYVATSPNPVSHGQPPLVAGLTAAGRDKVTGV